MPHKITTKQTPGQKGGSAPAKTSTGSGSRPSGGKYKIESSAPSAAQKIRG